jgi:chromosome segregation ATPase
MSAAPFPSRLGVVEAALATERAKRETAERSLQEARATLRDLQTQLGHAELARREASEAVQAVQDGMDALRAEFQQREARLYDDLAAERMARAAAERAARVVAEAALHETVVSRVRAEQDGPAALASRSSPGSQVALAKRAAKAPAAGAAKRVGKTAPTPKQREPQPVKWWLKTANRR